MMRHKNINSSTRFTCEKYNAIFKYKTDLKSHVKKMVLNNQHSPSTQTKSGYVFGNIDNIYDNNGNYFN